MHHARSRLLPVGVLVVVLALLVAATGSAEAQSRGSAALVPDALQATSTLESNSDAFVSSQFPNANYGSQGTMSVGQLAGYGAVRSLVWFDVVGPISKDQAVTDASLRMYLRGAGPLGDPSRDVVIYRVRHSWPEAGVTWDNFPSYEDKRLATTGVGINAGNWFEWGGVKELVQRARLPEWNDKYRPFHGLYVQGFEADGSYRTWDTREGTNKPQMRVEHITDTKPPTSSMDQLPAYTNKPASDPNKADIKLSWDGEDPSPYTGIDYFKLYVRRNDGEWFLSGDKIRSYEITYPAENGGVYQFVTYAVDPAGNLELTKPDPGAQTHVDLSAPTTTVKPLPEYVSGPFLLEWEGVDNPTGNDMVPSGISTYRVLYRVDGGDWAAAAFDVTGTSMTFGEDLIDGALYEFVAGSLDKAGNYDDPVFKSPQASTTVDMTPPTVVFSPVSGIDNPTFVVSWAGDDGGGSGTVSYDIQYRRGGGPWLDWVINTTRTSETFQGQFTNIYEFRGRARDAVGNQGEYPDEYQLVVGVIDLDDLPNVIQLPVANPE